MGQSAIIGSITELYNQAQIDVMERAFIKVYKTLEVADEHHERFTDFIEAPQRGILSPFCEFPVFDHHGLTLF